MKTIEDLLSEVAEITGAAPQQRSDTKPKPAPTVNVHIEAPKISASSGLINKLTLSLGLAKEIAHCIERGAEMLGVNVVIAVANESGRLILLEAMDNSYIASIDAAQQKAYTAAALKMPTHTALHESRGGALDGYTNGNGILMLGGGYPIESNGTVIGSIGVSGGTKEQDMLLAKIGIEYFGQRIKSL